MKLPRFSVFFSCLLLFYAVALKAYAPPFVVNLQNRTFDLYQILTPRPYTPAPVRIVDIDDASLARIGQWPWSRNILSALVEKLDAAGASAIAFDIVFAENDRTSPKQAMAPWAESGNIDVNALPDYDVMLAQSIEKSHVVTGFVLTHDGLMSPASKGGMAMAGDDPKGYLPWFHGAVTTIPVLEQMAKGNGALNSDPDADGILRRLPLMFQSEGRIYPSLAAEALRVAQGASSYTVKTTGASGESGGHGAMVAVKTGDVIIPTDAHGSQWLYYSLPEPSRYISAWQILDGSADASAINGSIVLIGTSAAGLKDIRATPLNPAVAGVEIFAQALEQAMQGITLSRPDWMNGAEIVLMIAAAIMLLCVNAFLSPLWGLLFALLMLATTAGFSWYAFLALHLLVEPIMPALAVTLVYLSDAMGRYMRAERERSQVRQAFSQYMSPWLVKELAAHPEKLSLGGENKQLSIMFCDMQDFTSISEPLAPTEVTELLVQFLTPVTKEILARHGTVDKYIGDCAMAFWNAPLDDAQHAHHAAQAALAIRAALATLNEQREKNAQVALIATTGLNSGICCVGNMGTAQRFNYSALGDEVNLAARLQSLCKHYAVDIIIGEGLATQIPGMALLELDLVRVKGKKNAVRIFALLGDETLAARPDFIAWSQQHGAMLEQYRRNKWDAAEQLLATCRTSASSCYPSLCDGLYARFAKHIDRLRANDVPWDGVFDSEKL